MRRRSAVVVVVLSIALSACGRAEAGPEPAGRNPSPVSKMVCSTEAKEKLGQALGHDPTAVTTPTWNAHLYSCTYEFPQGTMVLSVKELSSVDQTTAYFDSRARQLGRKHVLYGLGQGAFLTDDGSVVARKDYKVLTVDTSGLPSGFGAGDGASGTPAQVVTSVIMGCWAGD